VGAARTHLEDERGNRRGSSSSWAKPTRGSSRAGSSRPRPRGPAGRGRTRSCSRPEVELKAPHLAQQGEGGALAAGGGRPEAPEQVVNKGEVEVGGGEQGGGRLHPGHSGQGRRLWNGWPLEPRRTRLLLSASLSRNLKTILRTLTGSISK
jgi:hypothetical protein